jgi:hypothetical protein
MKEETKEKAKDVAKELTEGAAEWLKDEANASTGIMRWVYGILFILAMGALAVFFSACSHVPQVNLTVEQIQTIERIYTATGGEVKYRVVPVEPFKK